MNLEEHHNKVIKELDYTLGYNRAIKEVVELIKSKNKDGYVGLIYEILELER